jgi:putative sporulation protein YtaF
MLKLLSLTVLAFAVSLDSFGVGLTYGIRNIRIPVRSIVVITLCSAAMIVISMQLGLGIMSFLPPSVEKMLGPIILIFVGCWVLWQMLSKQDKEELLQDQEKTMLKLEIRSLGLVVHILKKPTAADVDGSGFISPLEATLLGLALSIDAFGAGIGAAMVGFSPWITAILIAFMSGLFLAIGLKFGRFASHLNWIKNITYLPGCLLILIGLLKLWT